MAYLAEKLGSLFSSFGAIGDGVIDDTAALQRAIDYSSTFGKPVFGEQGKTYLVSFSQTQSGIRTALVAKNGMYFDLGGATIKMANGQAHTSIIQTLNFTVQTPITLKFFGNGTFDGNNQNQTVTPLGNFSPTLYLNNVAYSKLLQIKVINSIFAGLYCSGNKATMLDNEIDDIYVSNSNGSGVQLVGTGWRVGRVFVRDCLYLDSNAQGNPFIVDISDSTIGEVYVKNFGFGVKFQGTTTRVTVDSIIAIGGANNLLSPTPERGVKFEGSGSNVIDTVSVGQIICQDIPITGLYCTMATNISIGSYSGKRNATYNSGTLSDRTDIGIFNGSIIKIGSVASEDFGYKCLVVGSGTDPIKVTINSMRAKSSVSTLENPFVILISLGQVDIDTLEVQTTLAKRIISVTSASSSSFLLVKHLIANIDTTLYYTGSPTSLFTAGSGDQVEVTRLTIPGFKNTFINQALTANSTTTTVTSQPAITYNVGDFGCYLRCIANNAASIAIAGTAGTFKIAPRQMSAGGGFVITHASDPSPGSVIVEVDRYYGPFAGPQI